MEISFNKNPNDVSGAEPVKPVESTQLVTTPVADLAIECRNTHTEVGFSLGSDQPPSFDQVILPRTALVHYVGKLKDIFPPGAIVFDQRLALFTPSKINAAAGTVEKGTPPVIITVLAVRPLRYVEKVAGGGRGLIFNTEAQVTAAGGSLDYNEWAMKQKDGMLRFEYLSEFVIAIERPECCADDGTTFTFKVDDKAYALALLGMKGTAHTVAKRTLYRERQLGCLREGYATFSFALSSTDKPMKDGTNYKLPVLVAYKKSTPEFLKFAALVSGAKHVETPDVE